MKWVALRKKDESIHVNSQNATGVVTEAKDLTHLENGNLFIGSLPLLETTEIKFVGQNNILFCEEGVNIQNSKITFKGDNALVYLGRNKHKYLLSLSINHNSVFHMGRNNYINGRLNIILSERKHFFVGNDGLFSFGIWVRNADPHLIYSCDSFRRINPTKSIFIGDHVWVGQSVFLLKGTQIDSGSIIGAMSVCSGKRINHNSSWAGNPIRRIGDSIFWDRACVHRWRETETDLSQCYYDFVKGNNNLSIDSWMFQYDPTQVISFDEMDVILDGDNPKEKADYLSSLAAKAEKNRFVHLIEPQEEKKALQTDKEA